MFLCHNCNNVINFDKSCAIENCSCGQNQYIYSDGIYENQKLKTKTNEMTVRDRQAKNYMKHAKFPTQNRYFSCWLKKITKNKKKATVLDLGCGPGPTTLMLLENNFDVVSVDFSKESLLINRESSLDYKDKVVFIQEDLGDINLKYNMFDYIVMSDFLQHLNGRDARERLLKMAFNSLKPGGGFYLTFFNLNILNYIKGDIHGGFSDGNIKYERLSPKNIVRYFPENIVIEKINPMNIFHSKLADQLASKIPCSRYFARMISIEGKLSS